MTRKIYNIVLLLLLQGGLFYAAAQNGKVKQMKLTDFKLQSSSIVVASGKDLSTTGFKEKEYWFPVKVPCTVLTGLVANNVYPDPYQGLNNMRIPDASDSFNQRYNLFQYSHLPNQSNPWAKPYWYKTTFTVPQSDKGRHFELIFKGINYRAEVWLNGQKVADSSMMAGMFATYNFDVSPQIKIGENNALAVKIFPLDFPGEPDKEQLKALESFYLNGGPTGDIGKNVTMLCSVGWDWMPPVRDRNMGIWQPIYLRTSGNATIKNVQIKTELPNLPDTSVADLSISLFLKNNSPVPVTNGKLTITVSPESFTGKPVVITKNINLALWAETKVTLDKNTAKELVMKNPHLWNPAGYGKPELYRMRINYSSNGVTSDDTSFVFGIRSIDTKTTDVNGWLRRDFYVNGKKVHLVGGAWVPDMMLNRDSLRFDNELRLCKNANVNLVRIWGGGITPPDVFFDIADRLGLMVWSDFWITGDTQGEFKGSPDWPFQSNVFIRNMVNTIYRIRNHPSLLVWTGGNEGHARKEIYNAMRDAVASIDGTRPFIPNSSGFAKFPEDMKRSWPDDKASGVYSGGPYAWRDPMDYYNLVNSGKDWVFKDETGLPSQPPISTLHKIIPNLVWDTTLPYPLNHTWGYHDACTSPMFYNRYYNEMETRYGKAVSLEDFSIKMQLLNAIGYRGIFEAVNHKLNETGGVMLWKLNAAFPSVAWQIYDWYLQPNAGYYFMQNACEPVHIQFCYDDSSIILVNRSYVAQQGLSAEVNVYDINGTSVFNKNISNLNLPATDVKETLSLANVLTSAKGVNFAVLRLKDANGNVISRNIYWLAPGNNCQSMQDMSKSNVEVKLLKSVVNKNEKTFTYQLINTSNQLAFFINLSLNNANDEIAPCFWSSNYVTLAPKESMTVSVTVPLNTLKESSVLQVSGWNVVKQQMKLQ
ncbi:beta galactosidase jelly roll domain-containing protein [Chitinophagaceae bacterium LB-8]|uniref:Beta galactosidase jelly roll domain-containing protein n=1 Tax=Paraflavisolibacter caeni TaxID=2982496 RepID=A0A9X3BH33_9BACT|nr:sugar-binding domain-containing protein [Paraflavisolibacter caeni]MCU7548872.1 beta galactosidase jelly roll domain-containing protein [Paraflavisolibacter caeni]